MVDPQPVLVLNGPNLGRLGRRQPEVYGRRTHDDIAESLVRRGEELGLSVDVRQTDSEAYMISWLHEAADQELPVIINPAAWSHYNIAIADAVAQCTADVYEVHLSNIHAREEFRRHSVVSPYVNGVLVGLGTDGYELALAVIAWRRQRSEGQVHQLRPPVSPVDDPASSD